MADDGASPRRLRSRADAISTHTYTVNDTCWLWYLLSIGELSLCFCEVGIVALGAFLLVEEAIDTALIALKIGLSAISYMSDALQLVSTYLHIIALLDRLLHRNEGAFCILRRLGQPLLHGIQLLHQTSAQLIIFPSQSVGPSQDRGVGLHRLARGRCFVGTDDGRVDAIELVAHTALKGCN